MIKAQGKTPAILKIYDSLDVCGGNDTKQCTVSLSIGQVTSADSLYGFDFKITYNPNKFQFNTGLTINTLSQFFENYEMTFPIPGVIMCSAANFGVQMVTGNYPLAAFSGKYKADCPDTSYIKLAYLDFTEEFKKPVDISNVFLKVEAKALAATKSLTTGFNIDTLKDFGNDSIAEVDGTILTKDWINIDSVEIEITTKNIGQHEIIEIKPFSDSITIDSLSNNNNVIRIKVRVLKDLLNDSVLVFKIKELVKTDSIDEILIKPIKVNECGCIKNLIGSNLIIKGTKADTTHENINDNQMKETSLTGFYDYINEEFIIKDERNIIDNIKIFDLQSNLIYMKKIENNIDLNISAKYFSQGIYFAIIKCINGENKKIVLI
ncbi:MAG: cohesin domain-containing protein, partial [FCB group bacterium]